MSGHTIEIIAREIPVYVRNVVLQRDGGRCYKCLSDEPVEYCFISSGGKDKRMDIKNIRLLCHPCIENYGKP